MLPIRYRLYFDQFVGLTADCNHQPIGGQDLNNRIALNDFLASVEKRAFGIAQLSTGNREDALDLVQEAMLRFAKAYARRPLEQWPPLFHRVLQNRIRDWHRRQGIRRRIFDFFVQSEADETDPINAIRDATNPDPAALALGDNTARTLMKTLKTLPHRQRQAFLLRVWEGFDVTSTATAMACSEGSVKTHLSRAMSRVRAALQDEADE